MKALLSALVLLLSTIATAETFFPMRGPAPDGAALQGQWWPGGSTPATQARLRASYVFHKTASHSTSLAVSLGTFHFESAPRLASGRAFPIDLWEAMLQFGYNRNWDDGTSLGFTLGFGSNSDRPFRGINETILSSTVFYRVPAGGEDAWLFLLNFSTNRSFANYIPIPGVAYQFKSEDKTIEGLLGLPFASLRWQFAERWDLVFALFGPTSATVEIGHRPLPFMRFYAGAYWSQELWLRAGRPDSTLRLVYDAKRAAVGVQLPLPPKLLLDLSGGWAFDRRVFEGTSILRLAGRDETSLDPSFFLNASLRVPF